MTNVTDNKDITFYEAAEMLKCDEERIVYFLGIKRTSILDYCPWYIYNTKALSIEDVIRIAVIMAVQQMSANICITGHVTEALNKLQNKILREKREDLNILKYPPDEHIEDILIIFPGFRDDFCILRRNFITGKCTKISMYSSASHGPRIEEKDNNDIALNIDEGSNLYSVINVTKIIKGIKFPKEGEDNK